MRTCDHLLISSSIRAIVFASAAAGLFAPAAALAQTTAPEKLPPAKKKQKAAPPSTAVAPQPGAIVVTGQRKALETATEMKRQSDTISDSIVLEEAGKVPSTSLLETLERVPGVTMNRVREAGEGSPDGFTFEGSGIQIRGLTGTKTLVNGLEVFSANGGDGVSYSDIGPELLRAVTVYKAGRADLIEGGIAGTVDLQTYMPFDFKGTSVSGSVSGSYGDFSKKITPSASLRASTRFHTGIGEFGLLAEVAYSKIESYDSNALIAPYYPAKYNGGIVYAPGGFSNTDDQFERTRKGFYGALQWRPTPNLEFYQTSFITEWNSQRNTQLEIMAPPGSPGIGVSQGSVFDNGVFVSGGITNSASPSAGIILASNASFTPSYSRTEDFSQGFKYSSGRFNLSGSYQYVTAKSGFSKYGIGLNGGSPIQTNIDTTSVIPDISFASPLEPNPAVTVVSNFAWLTQSNKSHANNFQLDASYDLGDGFFKKLAVGARLAKRQESDNFVGTWWSAAAKGWNGVPTVHIANAPAGDFYVEQFPDFFKGNIQTPASVYVPSPSILQGSQFDYVMNTYAACAPDLYFHCSNPTKSTYFYGNPPDPTFLLQPSFSTTEPTTKAAYAMVGFSNERPGSFLNFSGNVGVRWVRYEAQSQGNFVFSGSTTYYQTLADAQASLAAMGGNYTTWAKAHPGQKPPLSLTSVSSSTEGAGSFAHDYFMPSLNLEFKPAPTWIVRYALTEGMTPPLFSDIRAQGTASVFTTLNPLSNASGLPGIFAGYNYAAGKPDLKPETSLNNDFSIEWYPRHGTTMHLALFDKSIKNAIIYNTLTGTAGEFFPLANLPSPMSVPAAGGSPIFVEGPIVAKGNINATGHAIIKGFELGGQTYFDSLPGWLRGFGVDANVTYIDGRSPSALALDMNGNQMGVPLIGLSKWAYSATLLYDLHKFSARLAWDWRSRYLVTESDSSTSGTYTDPVSGKTITFGLPVYAAAAGRLSASIGYEFNKHFNLRLNVENITNSNQRTLMEILPGRYVQRGVFQTDRRVSLRAGFNF